jgi:hypothetical protein
MTIETKYAIDQPIFTLISGIKKVSKGKVQGIFIEYKKGPDGVVTQNVKYTDSNGVGPLHESEWFESKEELLKSL